MTEWGDVIESMPDWFKIQFYRTWDGQFKTCRLCGKEYPLHSIFYSVSSRTKTGFLHACKVCCGGEFSKITGVMQMFRKYVPSGYRLCSHCKRILPDDERHFIKSKRRCKECLHGTFDDTRYYTGLKLSKQGKKLCSYCNEVKQLLEFDRVNSKTHDTRYQEYCKDCASRYREHKREYDKEYYERNKSKRKEYYSYWRNQMGGREIRKMDGERRRSRSESTVSDLSMDEWYASLLYFEFSCAYCGVAESESTPLTQDHVIPVSQYGPYTRYNIVPSCRSCNSSKNKMSLEEFAEHSDKFTFDRYIKILNWMMNEKLKRCFETERLGG